MPVGDLLTLQYDQNYIFKCSKHLKSRFQTKGIFINRKSFKLQEMVLLFGRLAQ